VQDRGITTVVALTTG
nr:immunoglobulin heavy chain junction region [Mus musculus]